MSRSIFTRRPANTKTGIYPPHLGMAMTAIALVLLIESLAGNAYTVLAFSLAVAIGAATRIGHPILLLIAAVALAANTFVLPAILQQSASVSVMWVWLPVWCLEGLVINWLLVVLLRGTPGRLPSQEALAPLSDDLDREQPSFDLVMESSSQSQERFRLMVESIRDYAIVMLSPEGCVASWNVGAERILGYRASQILGRNHARFYLSDDIHLAVPQRDLATAKSEGKFEVECWRRRKDNTRLWAHVGVTPMRSASGTLLGFATIIRDITERRRAEESLRQAHDELEARVRARTSELAEANHALQAEVLERIQTQEVLEKQSAVLRSILDSIGDAIIVAEDYGKPLTFNSAARELFGIGEDSFTVDQWCRINIYKTVDLSGSCLPDAVSAKPLYRALEGEAVDDLELLVQPSGSSNVRWVLANARPLRNPFGGSKGGVVAFRDITERRRHAQELKEAKEAAESASRAKDRFLAILSHELRTPLTPILLAVSDLLERTDLGGDIPAMLAMIHRNTELEARLIDDILDLTRATTGRLTLATALVDIHRVITHAVEVCRSLVTESQLELRLELGATCHHLNGDSGRLQQVFWNLIKNAVKFTPRGGKITIRTWNTPGLDSGEDDVRFLAQVSDTGIGIEPDRLPRIFNAFDHTNLEQHRIYGGLGLGLAISRSVVEAHGGQLTAFSDGKDCGAAFTVKLMAQPSLLCATVSTEDAGENHADKPGPEGLRILLVDDNRDTLRYLAGLLQERGHVVNPAPNFRTAMKLAEANVYDLVISDIELPDGSGLDIIRDLNQSRPTLGIALSGFGSADDVLLSLEAGFAEHLTKPIDVRKLDAAIARVTAESSGNKPSIHQRAG